MTEIIAEIGSNPYPQWDLEKWCMAVSQTGAQKIKIQVFRAEHFPEWAQAEKRQVEFPRARLGEFARLAHTYGLAAGASVFDAEAVELCAKELDFLKLACREEKNDDLINAVLETRRPFYRSIDNWDEYTSLKRCTHLWVVQKYPLGMMRALYEVAGLSSRFKVRNAGAWGWSSHSTGWLDCWLASRLGASVVEKHFCISPDDPESAHSLMPAQFKRMVERCQTH